jgi:hypothetical protein
MSQEVSAPLSRRSVLGAAAGGLMAATTSARNAHP